MDYDPIKDRIGALTESSPFLTRVFFLILHTVFLRSWYVRRELGRQINALLRRRRQQEDGQSTGNGQAGIRMLDAGTGFAQFSDYVARRWPTVRIDAVDVKTDYLDRARHQFERAGLSDRVNFFWEDLTDLQTEGPYDLILSVDVMEHIEDDEGVFRHFERVLAPGGVVIINTPSDQGGSDVSGDADASFIGEHVRDGYGVEEIADKLHRAGLKTSHILYTYARPGSIAWRILIKWPMRMLAASWLFILVLPFWYLFALVPGLLLHMMDMRSVNDTGTGLLAVAEKSDADLPS